MSDYQTKPWRQTKLGAGRGHLGGLVALILAGGLLTACAGDKEGEGQIKGVVEGFAGLVAADEPRAAVIGRDILGNGGNAADAAVAMYFAMAVTLPSRVGLGGGGVCSVFDNGDRAGAALTFLPVTGPSGGVVPAGPRAMAALHARQGLQRWSQLLTPAENLARFGHGVSRAFAADLAVAKDLIAANPALSAIYRTAKGGLPKEGDQLIQFELAGSIGGLRAQGAAYLYGGSFTSRFAEAATQVGHPITAADLRGYRPRFGEAAVLQIGKDRAYFSAAPTNGLIAAQIYALLTEIKDYGGAGEPERAHLLAESAMRAFAARAVRPEAGNSAELLESGYLQGLFAGFQAGRHSPAASLPSPPSFVPENPAGAGFVVGDRFGNAVACSLTMNGLFGSAKVAPGTGILMANRPDGRNNGILPLSTVVIGNSNTGDLRFAAAAGAGGVSAPTALAQVMLRSLVAGQPVSAAVAAPRLHHGGAPDELFHEPDVGASVVSALRQKGYGLRQIRQLGQVNAFHCPGGVLSRSDSCDVASDTRGMGLAVIAR